MEYLSSQRLGRLSTVNASNEPRVVPVAFRYNEDLDTIDIGGHNLARSKKFRDAKRNGRAAFVVGDVLPTWQARGIEVRGRAEVFSEGGNEVNPGFEAALARIHPARIVGWGIDTDAYRQSSRSISQETFGEE
ncbi:MAG TPA: PPOX class F420-dependent oxidoreductase [Rubrobacteraceae bacterium]|nr:PPOX class F420-dependent oxidoreductase [Rubrobacteraceae bacterium]